MAIIWLDIWSVQSSNNAKELINRCFNVRSYIATIQGINMNLEVLQCKNHQKWGHSTFLCRIQESKCVKCNGPHKTKYYRLFAQYYKVNFKLNLSRLKTKQGELYLHMFKCINYNGDYQADSNICPFWKHHFNRKWHIKKYQEIYENRNKSIHLFVNGTQV